MTAQIKIIIITVLVIVISGFGVYVKHLIASNSLMKKNISELETTIEEKDKAYIELGNNYSTIIKLNKASNIKEKRLKKEYNILYNKFNKIRANGTKRDIGALLLSKPSWMEKLINKASYSTFKCFENTTKNEKCT